MRVRGGVGESSSELLMSESSADVWMRRNVPSGLLKASGLVFGSVRMSLLLQKALKEGYARNLPTWQVSVFCRMVRFVNS
jgi:hypothetical protein